MSEPTYGEQLTSARKKAGYSQEELGRAIGVSQQSVTRWEKDGATPRGAKCSQIKELLGVEPPHPYHAQLLREAQTNTAPRTPKTHDNQSIIELLRVAIKLLENK
jgi:transcriptional regulator with XRE-family HTH domain